MTRELALFAAAATAVTVTAIATATATATTTATAATAAAAASVRRVPVSPLLLLRRPLRCRSLYVGDAAKIVAELPKQQELHIDREIIIIIIIDAEMTKIAYRS
jgi:hypothetical protein